MLILLRQHHTAEPYIQLWYRPTWFTDKADVLCRMVPAETWTALSLSSREKTAVFPILSNNGLRGLKFHVKHIGKYTD